MRNTPFSYAILRILPFSHTRPFINAASTFFFFSCVDVVVVLDRVFGLPSTTRHTPQGSEHAINFDNGPESRPSRDRLRTAIQRALSSAATIATDDNMRQQRRSSALSSPASTFDPSELNADMTGGGPDAIDACEMSRKITTTGIHLGQRVMLVDTSQYDHQRGTLR